MRIIHSFFLFVILVWVSPGCQPGKTDIKGPESQPVHPGSDESEDTSLMVDPDRELPGPHNKWTISLRGWGPLKIGMSLEDTRKLLPFALDSQADPESDQQCFVMVPADSLESYAFMFIGKGESARLARIYFDTRVVRTLSGISVGSKESEVHNLYGTKIQEQPHKYVEGWKNLVFLPVDDADKHLRIIFTSDGQFIQQISVGKLPEIEYVESCN
jgi:hypothetical protein